MTDDIYAKALGESLGLHDDIMRDVKTPGGGLLLRMLDGTRREAVDALTAMIDVDAANLEQVRELQTRVRAYRMLADWVRRTLREGKDAWRELDEQERREMAQLLESPPNGDNDQ